MPKQGSSDPTSPRREASLFDLPASSEPGIFFAPKALNLPLPNAADQKHVPAILGGAEVAYAAGSRACEAGGLRVSDIRRRPDVCADRAWQRRQGGRVH